MKGTLVTIKIDGRTEVEHVDSVNVLAKLQKIVGGNIETIPGFTKFDSGEGAVHCVAFCNEDGKNDGLLLNSYAQAHWRWANPSFANKDLLVGDIVVVYGDAEFMEEL